MFGDDVFISYGHLDNQSLVSGGEGWVSEFHRLLEIRLSELLGKRPAIYRDQKLAGNDEFAAELMERVARAALLVPVLTPAYTRSEWCVRELLAFCEASSRQPLPNNKSRVFKVLKTPVPPERQPQPVQSSLGFRFYSEHPETGVPRELRLKIDGELQQEFLERLADLAYHVAEALRHFESSTPRDIVHEPERVYLAEPSSDQRAAHDRVRRDLLEHGYKVLPERDLPDECGALEAYLDEAIASCSLSIHIVGSNYGVVPDCTDRSRVAIQAERARLHAHQGDLARLIWLPAGLEVSDPRQREFVQTLRTDPEMTSHGSDLLEGSIEDLLTQVHRTLAARQPTGAAPDDDELPSVYLICDRGDTEHVGTISDVLAEHGCVVNLPEFDADEADFREYDREMLRSCDAAIVYYKSANRHWLDQKLQDLRRLPALGRERPLRSTEILVNPPRSWHGRFPRAHVVRTEAQDPRHVVDPVLADLGRL